MANNTKTKARQSHQSPGTYSRETEISYAVKSTGITKLGLVGETLRGRAFEPFEVNDWVGFKKEFGGTDARKFKGSQYPKYELPYIAKEFLKESKTLSVCRVLGLSGYNAGPAWLITASGDDRDENGNLIKRVVAVLRARGDYRKSIMFNKNANNPAECACQYTSYDTLIYRVGEKLEDVTTCDGTTHYDGSAVKISPYYSIDNFGNECEGYNITSEDAGFAINTNNPGQFTISGTTSDGEDFSYPVSLNPADNHYILSVFGTTPESGEAPLWVEALYDVNLLGDIRAERVTRIDNTLTFVDVQYTSEYCGTKLVSGILNMGEEMLTKRMLGTRVIADPSKLDPEAIVTVHPFDALTNKPFVAKQLKGGETSGITDDIYAVEVMGNKIYFDGNGFVIESGSTSGLTSGETSGTTAALELLGLGASDVRIDTDNCLMYATKAELGQIYTVRQFTDKNSRRQYVYSYYPEAIVKAEYRDEKSTEIPGYKKNIVPIIDKLIDTDTPINEAYAYNYNITKRALAVFADGYYYRIKNGAIERIVLDMNNYKSEYRHAMTPWFVSQVKGDAKHINLNKLFRFHTINDGSESNYELKVSISNILPDSGLFDVEIRDINDSDSTPVMLERYTKCSLIPGTSNYLGYKIGTFDGAFAQKSVYVTVEIAEGDAVHTSVPCGYIGYPTNVYSGIIASGSTESEGIISPDVQYNTVFDNDIKARKQYFGVSDMSGYDIDLLTFKGRNVYTNDATYLGNGFHMDCRISPDSYAVGDEPAIVTVDGVKGYKFTTVDINNRTEEKMDAPVLSNEITMEDSIYSDVNTRKFTALFYGGFDGWDVYRDQRTNTDEFKLGKYKGVISETNGEGRTFERIQDGESLELVAPGITSDYYAYLAGIRQFANPQVTDINVLATPGIDLVNNGELVKETIEVVEEERGDAIYVVTIPDKPSGASDSKSERYTASEAVDNLEESDINSSYACTFFPWIKYHDEENNVYINLPLTKDVVRDMAYTDNIAYPWFAPVGYKRGKVVCEKMHGTLKLNDEDVLYSSGINYAKPFGEEGLRLWGQKTLMKAEIGEDIDNKMLSRIAVRRMMLRVRKLVAIGCNKLIFDPNDPTMLDQFRSTIEPILTDLRNNRGISDFRLIIDSDAKSVSDRREINGKIGLKPYQALEWINLDYMLTDEGVSFDDI